MLTFDELWKRLNDGDESVEIEAKTAQQIGPSVQQTVCAFANEPNRGGGYILLGVSRMENSLFPTYEIVGVPDPDRAQSDLASQCRSVFKVVIRPQISVATRSDNRVVLVVFIPEAQPHEKPVFIESKGLPKGAFRRIASTDQVCTEDDLQALYQGRNHQSYDETVVEGCTVDDLDPAAIEEYRRTRREGNPTAPELAYGDADLLFSLCCASKHKGQIVPTIAGLLVFGKKGMIRRFFPMTRLDYIRVPGKEWVRDPDQRFESVDILDPIMFALPRAINTILDDIPKAFHLPADANRRNDVPLIPRTAIREAVVNAIMHRSYRQRSPIQIIRYSNRLEIRNPGHSLVPDERLGEPGSVTRNEKIAAVLHETRYAETKGSGIRAMREALARESLSPPTFESDREKDTFVVTFLFHHFLNAEDIRWLGQFASMELSEDEQRALVFVREMDAINNAAYRDLNRVETLVASGHLRRLRDLGLLAQKGRSSQTYYVPTEHLLIPPLVKTGSPAGSQGLTPVISAQAQGLEAESQGLAHQLRLHGLTNVPREVTEAIQSLGGKPDPARIRDVIRRLCAIQPLKAEQIAGILGRGKNYITRTYLGPMVRDRELEYTIPDNPAHPQLRYRAAAKTQE